MTKEAKEALKYAVRHLKESEAYILITWNEGLTTSVNVGKNAFSMLGGLTLVKDKLLEEIKKQTIKFNKPE